MFYNYFSAIFRHTMLFIRISIANCYSLFLTFLFHFLPVWLWYWTFFFFLTHWFRRAGRIKILHRLAGRRHRQRRLQLIPILLGNPPPFTQSRLRPNHLKTIYGLSWNNLWCPTTNGGWNLKIDYLLTSFLKIRIPISTFKIKSRSTWP